MMSLMSVKDDVYCGFFYLDYFLNEDFHFIQIMRMNSSYDDGCIVIDVSYLISLMKFNVLIKNFMILINFKSDFFNLESDFANLKSDFFNLKISFVSFKISVVSFSSQFLVFD